MLWERALKIFLCVPPDQVEMKKFKRHQGASEDHFREILGWISRGSHLSFLLDVVVEDVFGATDCSLVDCVASEDLLELVYLLLIRSRSFSKYLNLPVMIPTSTVKSFSDSGKVIAGLIYGVYLGKRESFLIDFVTEFSGLQDECFIREIQIQLNEKIVSANEKEQKIRAVDRFSKRSNAEDCSAVSSVWSESVKWFEEYCQFCDQSVFDTFLLGSTAVQYELLKKALIVGKPIVLSGAKGSGKSFALDYLAHKLGRSSSSIVHINAGDQMDAKTLVGSYICTEKLGEFKWVPGVIYNCLMNGTWLVIDDLHLASTEVCALLNSIAQSRSIFLPNRNETLFARSNFFLFATTSSTHPFVTSSILSERNWSVVEFEEQQRSDLEALVLAKFPSLLKVVPSLLNVYEVLRSSSAYRKYSKKSICSRDLLKWCQTAISFTRNIESTDSLVPLAYFEGIFKAAVVCFISCIPSMNARLEIANAICPDLYVLADRAMYLLQEYKPSILEERNSCSFGLVPISFFSHITPIASKSEPFAHAGLTCRIFEYLAAVVSNNLPCLLVGETGTGKTTIVQAFAKYCKISKFTVVNLNQQSEREDLLGGFKPTSLESVIFSLNDQFESLFARSFNASTNSTYLASVATAIGHRNVTRLIALYNNAAEMYNKKANTDQALVQEWSSFVERVMQLSSMHNKSKNSLLFSFVEGVLVDAIRHGHWILLDEINLAAPEVLHMLNDLVESVKGSVLVSERGDLHAIARHENFRLFACMNPSTDVNKRDLPAILRGNFVEIYVDELDQCPRDLHAVIHSFLANVVTNGFVDRFVKEVADTYYALKQASLAHRLVDGDRKRPHYSLRTLTRTLKFATKVTSHFGSLKKCLLEGFLLSFVSILSKESKEVALSIIQTTLLSDMTADNVKSLLQSQPLKPSSTFLLIEGFLVERGTEPSIDDSTFILTPYVRQTLASVSRALMAKNHPILLQGPTSAGKTSLVEYLAKKSGHKFVRINNHEQTDLQEYIGRYHSSADGKLVFKEGLLVEALKQGYWIVLDELNLASSDILEALNRLLDDNRELHIVETGEFVKPHPNFQLFATQNPSGSIYGGRKMLSRAFRNRFIEIHVEEIPHNELEIIIEKRCQLPSSYCKKLLSVYYSLMLSRESTTSLFAGKNGFITLRDLFRWGKRNADNAEQLAENGYILLAERMRNDQDRQFIKKIIEEVFRVQIDPVSIYNRIPNELMNGSSIIWTQSMRRLAFLINECILNEEPVLIVGETGCGKTTVVQALSQIMCRPICILNCHQNTETSDLLGSLRPSGKASSLFEWVDGPLVESMKEGCYFLLDEISLAEDSVLERLNSVLEPSRSLTLAERPSEIDLSSPIVANPNFRFFATMNPGGDFGKKELSPALRNRFTEIWAPAVNDLADIRQIVSAKIVNQDFVEPMLKFIAVYADLDKRLSYSLRDIIAWIQFFNLNSTGLGSEEEAFVWGCFLVFANRHADLDKRMQILNLVTENRDIVQSIIFAQPSMPEYSDVFRLNNFTYPFGNNPVCTSSYILQAPSTFRNALKVVAAMSIPKSILLEGSPGVGKTSLIQNLAGSMGYNLFRINLSEQTDLSDLFGSNLPVDGGELGTFAWKDGPFLSALKRGDWILLDELNLASQSVLEGLNSCLDHRGTIFIPELGLSFGISSSTRIFASQNPTVQGGGRKGLPKSFLNRFTCIYLDSLDSIDYEIICKESFPNESIELITKMVRFVTLLNANLQNGSFGTNGSPWEVNLRDIFRWFQMKHSGISLGEAAEVLFFGRFRSLNDVACVKKLYFSIFTDETEIPLSYELTCNNFAFGSILFPVPSTPYPYLSVVDFPTRSLNQVFSLLSCVKNNWLSILVGEKGTGKTESILFAAQMMNQKVVQIGLNPSIDTQELLGGYEQCDKMINLNGELENALNAALLQEDFEFVKKAHSGMENKNELYEIAKERNYITNHSVDHSNSGSFVWIDGPIVKAMIEGYWVVLDNANLCNSAVLDRLNSLFEADGSLLLTEQGGFQNQSIRNITPHPNFRLFMTVNPTFGEISRAMRNRGIEIYFAKIKDVDFKWPGYCKGEILDNSFSQLSPLLDSFSFNFLLDKHLMIKYDCEFSTALFLSSFHNEIDKQLRSKLTGIDCNSDYLISIRNTLMANRHSTNNYCYSGTNPIITTFLKIFDSHFQNSIGIKELVFRIYICSLESTYEEIINTVLNLALKDCSLPNITKTFLDHNPVFESYWNDNIRFICFSSQEISNYFRKICKIIGYPRKQHYNLFVEYLSNQTCSSQLSFPMSTDAVTITNKFPEHNFAKKFVCSASENIWSKFLLSEHFYGRGSLVQSNHWIESALCYSNLPIDYIFFCGNEFFKLNSFTLTLQERFSKCSNFNYTSFLQDAFGICELFKNSKLFQIPVYLQNINQIIDCFQRDWSFTGNFDENFFPFEDEFSKLTGISKTEVLTNPLCILNFIRSVFLSSDLAVELQCRQEIQNEKELFVVKANSILAEYSVLKYGTVRQELLFDEIVNQINSNCSIYRTYQFEQLSSAIVSLLVRIERKNYDFSNLHDFVENISKRFPEYPDYVNTFGFLIYLFAYLTSSKSPKIESGIVINLEYFHLYYLLSKNPVHLVNKLLSIESSPNQDEPVDSECDVDEIDSIVKEIFTPDTRPNDDLFDLLSNDSLEIACSKYISSSISANLSSSPNLFFHLKQLTQQKTTNFFTPNLEMMLLGNEILEQVFQKCLYLMTSDEELSDNPILLQIVRQINFISDLSYTTALSSIVCDFESFLTSLYQWQQFAHKGISLQLEIDKLSEFVLKCRKLEVDSYKTILQSELTFISRKNSAKLVHHLLTVCLSSVQESNFVDYLKSLDQFLLTASLGDFECRLNLLERLSTLNSENYCLASFIEYYKLIKPWIVQKYQSIIAQINKEYDEFLKLVEWKNVNVLYLKQSTEKSHKSIAKFIKKLRIEMSEPVITMLKDVPIEFNTTTSSIDSNCPFLPEEESIGSYKWNKCTSIVNNVCQKLDISVFITDLYEGIKERVKDLSSMSDALVQKTRAFDDLLKFLKSKGLTSKQLVIDSFELASYVPLSQSPNSLPSYFKALHLMNKMIQSYHSHSQFIDHVKATKLTGFILNLFTIAKTHYILAEQIASFNNISNISSTEPLFCILNLKEIQEFSINYQIYLMKIKTIGKDFAEMSDSIFKDLFEKAEFLKSHSRHVTLIEREKSTQVLSDLLNVNLSQLPNWLTFEFKQFLNRNNSLCLLFEQFVSNFDGEKTLLFYQNLDSLPLHPLVDVDEGDLADNCFSNLVYNDQSIEQLVNHFTNQNATINLFGEKYSFLARQNVNSLFRLVGLLSTVGYNLFCNGFCNEHMSQEQNQSSKDDELQLQNGTGMGEGDTSESKNVSDRIEDESQVEGLKDETKQESDKNSSLPEDEDQAFEMEMDFDGEYQDKVQSEQEDQGEEEESDESNDADETLENHQDNSNEFIDQLDEQFWQERSDEQQSLEEDEKTGDIENFQMGDENVACNEDDSLSKPDQEESTNEEEQESLEDEDNPNEQIEDDLDSGEVNSEETNDVMDAEENDETKEEMKEEHFDDEMKEETKEEHSTKDSEQERENSSNNDNANRNTTIEENFNSSFGNNKLNQQNNNGEGSGTDKTSNSNLSNESNEGSLSNNQSSNDQLSSGIGPSEPMQNMHNLPSQSIENCSNESLKYSNNLLQNSELINGEGEKNHENIPENQLFQQDESDNSMQIQSTSQKHGAVEEAKFNSMSNELESEPNEKEKLEVKSFSLLDQLKQTSLEASSNNRSEDDNDFSQDSAIPIENEIFTETLIKTPNRANLEIDLDTAAHPSAPTESIPTSRNCFVPATESSIHQWELIENKILQLSCELCEQLRLILEPTTASRLKGSYKSGKRLDMKKIIPFIASDYKKDKIWLRRTKPATRKYQILISIDDSKSMQTNNTAVMAFESLALISKALSTLESGQIGVLAFGESCNLIHNLTDPFVSCEFGPKVIENLQFNQSKTNLLNLMQESFSLLTSTRQSSDWQLHVILSDGIIHENILQIQQFVRKCFEQKILIIFVIVDCKKNSKDSITKMNNVTYITDPTTGKSSLKMQRYLDSFPFEHYLVVGKVECLPGVLADALRQWFDLIKLDD